jgi:hypothetical protein
MTMRPVRDPEVRDRVKAMFELNELAETLMRQNLRRRFPDESSEQIESRVWAWLQTRPGAEHGDAGGAVRPRRARE